MNIPVLSPPHRPPQHRPTPSSAARRLPEEWPRCMGFGKLG